METHGLDVLMERHAFFRGFDPDHLRFLGRCATNLRVAAGEYLVREGEEADATFLVREGRVTLEIAVPGKGAVQFDSLGADEIFGWSWLFPPYRWSYDARAVEPSRVIRLEGGCLREKCEVDHDLGYELLKRFLAQVHARLHKTRVQLLDLYGPGS
jgi:CRP-like cAMP-binding protein